MTFFDLSALHGAEEAGAGSPGAADGAGFPGAAGGGAVMEVDYYGASSLLPMADADLAQRSLRHVQW
eukprot:1191201-Prorocentrum_minimum.AAC.2